jgi:hypothetical protein
MSAAAPLVAVVRPVIHQQQNARVCDRVEQMIEQGLSFAIDPVQILEDDNQRLIEALS